MFKYFVIPVIILLHLTGCASIPFQSAERVPIGKIEPGEVKERFALMLPEKFRIINSMVFEYKGKAIYSFIGYSDVDTFEKTFTVAGLHQFGIKLFELTGNNDKTELRFVGEEFTKSFSPPAKGQQNATELRFDFEEFTKRGDFAEAVADDIKKIYFNRLPGAGAEASAKKYEIVFFRNENGATIEHVFAGAGNLLVEKRCTVDNIAVWSVYYYEYRVENGKLYPAGIILENHKYNYRLIIRLKEIMPLTS